MGNSIEEDITKIEGLKYLTLQATLNDKFICAKIPEDYIEAIEHILSDYKRVLKENEELKQEKINNYRMIALAQNETLGYMQGYEDGKKLKTSAIASIVENQQYYIIKKQMEKYEEHIKRLQKENEELKNAVNVVNKEKADWIRAYQEEKDKQFELLRSNIPIQRVKDKMEKDIKTNEHTILGGRRNGKTLEYGKRLGRIEMCQELLEGRK